MLKHQLSLAAAVVFALSVFLTRPVVAGPLTSAEVTKIINQVSVVDPHAGERPAAIRDLIKDDVGLETGKRSRSELLFQDNTLTRIAAETFFSFKTGTRDMTLEKGSMLLQVPKGLGGARIHTAAVTAAITGTTIMMEYIPKQYIKVLVLEGSLRVSRNGFLGDSVVLRPGKMLIMKPDAKKIPEPVNVDLAQIVKTSSLVNFPGTDPLPSMGLIQAAIEEQQKQIAAKNLAPTNLVMGRGANVLVTPTTGTISLAGATTTTPLINPVQTATTSVASAGNVTPTLGATVTTTTGTANNLVGSTTVAASNTLGSTAGTVSNLLASTTGTVTGAASNLLGAASTLTSTPLTAVDQVLNSTNGTVGSVTNTLLGTASNVTSIPVSSSSQLLSLVNTAVTSTGGVAAVTPTVTSTTSTLGSTPISTVTSVPTTSSVTSAVSETTATVASSTLPTISETTTALTSSVAPTTSTTTSDPASSTVPLVSSGTTTTTAPTTTLTSVTSAPTTTLSSVTSSPTTLLSSTSTTQSSTSSTSLLKLGH